MFALFVGLLGLIVGSFLNVLILRRHAAHLGGRSRCMSCGAGIAWYDNIPVLSWLILGGSCRGCKSAISIQYPLVEAGTGLLFAFFAYAFLPVSTPVEQLLFIVYLVVIALLVAIAVYDLRHTIIPDSWVWTFSTLAFVAIFVDPYFQILTPETLYAVLAGPIAALPLFALWFVSRGRWMGFGDVKLALGIGWLLGPIYGVYAIFFGFVVGAIISVCILLPLPQIMRVLGRWGIVRPRAAQSYTMKSEVPFGPFLIAACFLVWFALLYDISFLFIW